MANRAQDTQLEALPVMNGRASWTASWAGFFKLLVTILREFQDGRFYKARAITVSSALRADDCLILVDATAGNVTITAGAASDFLNKRISIKKTDASANSVIFDPTGTVDGAASKSWNTQYQSFDFCPDPSSNVWHVL